MTKDNDELVSFDVVSLYTNIPLSETIDLIANDLYGNKNFIKPPFSKLIFKRLLKIATEGIFLYRDKFYKQIDGVTMGSPLGPTLANYFLAYQERKFLDTRKKGSFYPRLYLRYVDDIFTVFTYNIDFSYFFDILNKLHGNLKFTYELGNSYLPFLDTFISISSDNFDSGVYRKETNTNVLLNFHAKCPKRWKLSLIHNMLNRAWTICSNYNLLHNEIEKLRNIFISNSYPVFIFENVVNLFLSSKLGNSVLVNDQAEKDMKFIFKIPFVGKPSYIFREKLSKTLFDNFGVKVNVIFMSCKVSSYFSLKSQTPLSLISRIVYKFTCLHDASTFYIGKTHRHFGVRVSEHLDLEKGNTAVTGHVRSCNFCQLGNLDISNFEILSKCQSKFDCKIKEAIFIKKCNPLINKQLHNSGSSFLLNIF